MKKYIVAYVLAILMLAFGTAQARVKLVTLPGLPPKGDVVDFLEAGGTKADVHKAIKDAPRYEPAAPARDTQAGSPGATPSYSDESPDPLPLDCEALLVEHELSDLDANLDRAVLEGRLRRLRVSLRGSDRLRVALVREVLITQMKAAKIRTGAAIGKTPQEKMSNCVEVYLRAPQTAGPIFDGQIPHVAQTADRQIRPK